MKRHVARNAAIVLLLGVIAWLLYWSWDSRQYWFLNNFRVVEPGRVYAGGYQYPTPLARVLKYYHIKTVLCLRPDGDPLDTDEQKLVAASGAEFKRVFLPPRVSMAVKLAAVEKAVAIMADHDNQPVFLHCWGGYHRTGIVVAVYRMRHCGWDEKTAAAELIRWGGNSHNETWPLEVLHAFCSHASTTEDPVSILNPAEKPDRFEQ